ncbi:hypothetical protein H9J87_003958 [Escherichia coli]|nr:MULTISPECIES: hypothetical protein [Enterobacterales]EAY4897023.1 hypothetical protein [Salmonella enterica]ECU6295783.1 hypothetical protein [Salmonella enterica subsp. enterica serovar Agona]EAY4898507.1 hypothetical protein [Salmonella enterica]EFJ2136616.1 hypothetical protein [Escherichia coli]EFN8254422.1 hypothetical protein [Escherichia coli]
MIKSIIQQGARQFGYMPVEKLNYARNIAKRLDEHRELVEAIASKTTLLSQCEWHIGHLATQDDFLMRLYYQVHSKWPEEDPFVRQRPPILGPSTLPEYPSELNTHLLNGEGKKNSHLAQEAEFDYGEAKQGHFYFYYIGDVNGFAIGKRDWVPVSVLIGLVSGRQWLLQKLSDGTWIDRESPLWVDWVNANLDAVMRTVAPSRERFSRNIPDELRLAEENYYADVQDVDVEERVMAHTRFDTMTHEYLRVMAITCPVKATTAFALAVPPEIYRYQHTATSKALNKATGEAIVSANKMAVAWFKHNGFEVDEEQQLVKVPDYQPLFFVGSQDL